MSNRAEYLFYVVCGLIAVAMLRAGIGPVYVMIVAVAMLLLIPPVFVKMTMARNARKYGRELDSPFLAEVLLDGQPVATLTDRVVTEMFWRKYKITPLAPELEDIIMNDDLWDEDRFTFRDPVSKHVCIAGVFAGARPHVRDGIINLRGLYFLPEAAARKLWDSYFKATAARKSTPTQAE